MVLYVVGARSAQLAISLFDHRPHGSWWRRDNQSRVRGQLELEAKGVFAGKSALQDFEAAVLLQIGAPAAIRLEQILGRPRSEFGSDKAADAGRSLEHGIEHQEVHGTAFADFETDDGERMAYVCSAFNSN